jgi:hypothetical protein
MMPAMNALRWRAVFADAVPAAARRTENHSEHRDSDRCQRHRDSDHAPAIGSTHSIKAAVS